MIETGILIGVLGTMFIFFLVCLLEHLFGDVDISDIVHEYIMELSLRQLLSLRRQLDARIEELKSGHVANNNLKGREVYEYDDARDLRDR